MYVVHGPISMRRMKSIGQVDPPSLPCGAGFGVMAKNSKGYDLVPTGKYIVRRLDVSSHLEKPASFSKHIRAFGNEIKGLEIVMSSVAIVYHSGFGHTQALAEAVAAGANSVAGIKASLIAVG